MNKRRHRSVKQSNRQSAICNLQSEIAWLLALLVVGAATPAAARQVEAHRLTRVDAVAPDTFSLIHGLRELSDGRVIVTDWIEERLVVMDFETGVSRDLGQVGGGPKEYRLPSRLLALAGDSTLLVDIGNTRLTVIGPELDFVRSISMYAHGERFRMSPRAVDRAGAMYFSLSPFALGPDAVKDSVPIVRWAPGYRGIERLGSVLIKGTTLRGPRMSLRPSIPFVMFSKQDGWTVTSDGWLAIVRSDPYRVEWYGPNGEAVAGDNVTYDVLPITMDDRRNFVRSWQASSMQSGRGEDGGMGHVPADQQSEREINRLARSQKFADEFPPFAAGRVWTFNDELVWVQRSLPADSLPTFDVFDRSGTRAAVIQLPVNRRVVGFGSGTLYATVADRDDLLTLERYRVDAVSSKP